MDVRTCTQSLAVSMINTEISENYGPRMRQTGPSGIAIGRGISHGERYEGGHDPVPMLMASLAIFSSRLCFA